MYNYVQLGTYMVRLNASVVHNYFCSGGALVCIRQMWETLRVAPSRRVCHPHRLLHCFFSVTPQTRPCKRLTPYSESATDIRAKAAARSEWVRHGHRGNDHPRKSGLRSHLRRERKAVATALFMKERLKVDSDQCWWCGSGGRQTREDLFKECSVWKIQINNLWRRAGRKPGWRHPKMIKVSGLFKEQKITLDVL